MTRRIMGAKEEKVKHLRAQRLIRNYKLPRNQNKLHWYQSLNRKSSQWKTLSQFNKSDQNLYDSHAIETLSETTEPKGHSDTDKSTDTGTSTNISQKSKCIRTSYYGLFDVSNSKAEAGSCTGNHYSYVPNSSGIRTSVCDTMVATNAAYCYSSAWFIID